MRSVMQLETPVPASLPVLVSHRTLQFPHPNLISLSEIVSALTFAIDLTEGAVPGHALRTCVLGMRLASAAGLSTSDRQALYHALLLKDIGCSSNAARICQIFGGDDRAVKRGLAASTRGISARGSFRTLRLLWREVLPANPLRRLLRIGSIGLRERRNTQEMIGLRCERGAGIARKLGLSHETSRAIHGLDERWDGSGYPLRLEGNLIPLSARILAVAQHLDAFACEHGCSTALTVLRQRSGTWFDPALVDLAADLAGRGLLWDHCLPTDDPEAVRRLVLTLEPVSPGTISADAIDLVCEAFADVVDAKSPFTCRHSIGVAEVATFIARALDLSEDRVQLVRRAALLHDLGKLSVPNTILDKQGKLTAAEWRVIASHSRVTREILARVNSFAELAVVAGAHHERLDGTGYPEGLTGAHLNVEARIVAVADCYRAMTEARPFRNPRTHAEAMAALLAETPHRLDRSCVDALARVES